jgi:formate hydrogenlyase transcriptional activator
MGAGLCAVPAGYGWHVVDWYAGAERIYGYRSGDAIGQHVSMLYPEDALRKLEEELRRARVDGHVCAEGWHLKKDGSIFWASVIKSPSKHHAAVARSS